MRRVRWYTLIMLMVFPCRATALQLHWGSGSTNLTFTSATRCTLVVQADPAEGRLPAEWRLLWVADSLSIQFVAMDSTQACALNEAQAARIDGPATAADSASNLLTEHFCSVGSSFASIAQQVLELPAGGRGKLKAVALDPTDPASSRVIESNEATYNGGIEGAYPAVVLHASSIHQSLQLQVTAVGSGLSSASSMSIRASDSSWNLPLTVTAKSNGSITGTASVAAALPACQATVGSAIGAVSAATLPSDPEPPPLDPQSCSAQFFEGLLTPPPPLHGFTIQPKDFAFTRGFVDPSSNKYALHLFYIRHNYWYDAYYDTSGYHPAQPDLNEQNIGHIWTTDFNSWYGPAGLNKPDTVALTVRTGKFDALHVWAPTIVQNGPMFTMFYTGVRSEQILPGVFAQQQRIGVATSTDLNTWTPADTVVLSCPMIPWASKDPIDYGHAQQLRDPFVMQDPMNAGQWLMYFVTVDSIRAPKMAVGVARSPDLLKWTPLPKPFSSTERPTPSGRVTTRVESPHVFMRNGQWWMPFTADGDTVFFETTASPDPIDTVATHWTNPVWLRAVAQGHPLELQYWHATEYLKITSAAEYLAAFNDNATSIEIEGIYAAANPAVDSVLLACPVVAGAAGPREGIQELRMVVSRLRWGSPDVRLRLELPSRMQVRVAVYDIAGRRRTTLLDRELAGGVTEVAWDGRGESGAQVASGVYFIRLTSAKGARVSKVVVLR